MNSLWQEKSSRLSDRRKIRLEQAAKHRTNHFRLVVQDVHDPHNVSACMRSAEAFGVLHVDVIHLEKPFKPSTASRGVKNWLTITKHKTVESCISALRDEGYLIAAGMPPSDSTVPLQELNVNKPLALVFGNEHSGISSEWLPHIDLFFTIPMTGLVESLNISVSAAITLFHLTDKAKRVVPLQDYYLKTFQVHDLLETWADRI